MTVRILRLPLVGAALLLALSVFAAQQPQKADDPLPKGAKVRFGVTRPILRTNPAVALIPPRYTDFLAPTMTGGIRRYDLGTGRPLQKDGIVGPGQVVVSADGKRAAVARPGALTVVDVASGKELLAVKAPDGVIIVGTPGVSLSGDGKVLAYGGRGRDGKGWVVVWDVGQNVALAQVETAQAAPVFPNLSRDGKTLITHGPPVPAPTIKKDKPPAPPKPMPPGAGDPDVTRTAQVWDVATGKELFKARVTGMEGMVVASAFSPDGSIVAVTCGDGPIDLWEVKTAKRVQTLLGRKSQGVRVAISPDGQTVASIGLDYRIQQWTIDGIPLGISEQPAGILVAQITGLTFADNERVIGWQTAAQFAVAWEGPTGRVISPAMDHAAAIYSISFPRGKDPHTSGIDGRVFRWDFPTGKLNEPVELHPTRIPGQPLIRPVVAMSADGTRATWLRNPPEVFDLVTGDDLFCIPPPSVAPTAANFDLSADALKLITTSRQAPGQRSGSCVVWDLKTQQRLGEFEIPGWASATAPAGLLSPDGKRVVIATPNRSPDGKQVFVIVGYDLKTGKKLAEVEDPAATGSVRVGVANDTIAVVTSSSGRVWTVDYANGRVGEDIETIAPRGEPPLSGPVAVSPDGKRFAVGVVGEPFTTYGVRVYDLEQRKALHTFIGHLGPVSALRFTPDGNFLASGAQDTSVLVWDLTKLPNGK